MNDITIRRPIRWVSASATNAGMVRPENEDSILDKNSLGLWVVADGMGGHEAGKVASSMIVDALNDLTRPQSMSRYVNEIENRLRDVNRRLLEYSEIMLDGRLIGSTFVGFTIIGQVGVCLWMGDSRLYLYRQTKLHQLSVDHSQVSELLQSGAITESEAIDHPDANVITRAIGTSDEVCIDYDVFSVQVGDVYLLCSDGLYNSVNVKDIGKIIEGKEPDDMVESLMGSALHNGATDNVSVIAIKGVRPVTTSTIPE